MSRRKNTYTPETRKISEIIKDAREESKAERETWRDKRKRSGWIFGALTWVTQIFVQAALMYSIGMFVAMSIIPLMVKAMFVASVKNGYQMTEVLNQVGYWGFPALFAVLMMFFAYACLMILIWKGLNKFLGGWRASHRANIAAKLDAAKKTQG